MGQKKFKRLCFPLKKGKFETFLIVSNECLTGIKLEDFLDFDSFLSLQNKAFYTNLQAERILNLIYK